VPRKQNSEQKERVKTGRNCQGHGVLELSLGGSWRLLVAKETGHGRVSGTVAHALVAVDEYGLGLDDDVLLGDQSLVLQVFERML